MLWHKEAAESWQQRICPESVKLNVFIKGSAVSSHLNNRDYETDYPLIAVKPDLVSKPDTVP